MLSGVLVIKLWSKYEPLTHYYQIAINYRKNELEETMLLNLHKKKWTDELTLERFDTHSQTNGRPDLVGKEGGRVGRILQVCHEFYIRIIQ
nr:26S proteasome non-ATPase regulatory subunit 14 homolog [Tanacetum cinerariifolium]